MAPFLLVKLKTRLGSMCRVDTKLQGFHFGCNICVLFFLVGLKVRIWSMWTALIWQALDCRTAHQSGKEHKKRELAQLRGNKWGRRTAQQTLTYLHNTVKATFDIQGTSPWPTKSVVVSSEVNFGGQSDIVGCHRQVVAGWVCWRRLVNSAGCRLFSYLELPWATLDPVPATLFSCNPCFPGYPVSHLSRVWKPALWAISLLVHKMVHWYGGGGRLWKCVCAGWK